MTTSAERAAILVRALRASVDGDRQTIADVYTQDVAAWTPAIATTSLAELMTEFMRRDDAFSSIKLETTPLLVAGDYACSEWTVSMTHTGPLPMANGRSLEPTGVRVVLHGVTVAEFQGEQIFALRQYWDELSVYEQLGLIAGEKA